MAEITVTFPGGTRIITLDKLTGEFDGNLRKGLRNAGYIVERRTKKNLSGPSHTKFPGNSNPFPGVLHNKLRPSVTSQLDGDGEAVRIGPGGFAEAYAAIQEFGGAAGRNHASIIPARPYLGPALEAEQDNVVEAIRKEVFRALL